MNGTERPTRVPIVATERPTRVYYPDPFGPPCFAHDALATSAASIPPDGREPAALPCWRHSLFVFRRPSS